MWCRNEIRARDMNNNFMTRHQGRRAVLLCAFVVIGHSLAYWLR